MKKLILTTTLLMSGILTSCGTEAQLQPNEPEPSATNAPIVDNGGDNNETNENVKTLFVDSKMATCTGVGLRTCLRVRESASQDWELFYDRIEGFDYESGFAYELKVKEEKVENPPADASSIKTTLIEVVKKEAATVKALENTRWSYLRTEINGTATEVLPDTEVTLNFSENSVSGSAGCNTFGGDYTQKAQMLSFSALFNTERFCLNDGLMEQEADYLKRLAKVSQARQENGMLILTYDTNAQLIFEALSE